MLCEKDLDAARYETKFVTHSSDYHRLKNWLLLHPDDFYSPYPLRVVNNIYFDTHECDSYVENLTGCTSRSKIRLRWYGAKANPTSGMLELKSKRNKLGFKAVHAINLEKPLFECSYNELLRHIQQQCSGDLAYRFSNANTPVIINSYTREYFVTRDNKVRTTIDTNLAFFDQRFSNSPQMQFSSLVPEMCIFEVKTAAKDIDIASKVISEIEFAPSKSSKYVLGVQSLLGYQ